MFLTKQTGNFQKDCLHSAVSEGRSDSPFGPAIEFASELARRYELSSLAPLLDSCRSAVGQSEVSVAVVGRFKAGKSSFLNHFTNRSILPVGVVPVTAVVTEVRFGTVERAFVRFLDGHVAELPVESIGQYVSERENPANCKRVGGIAVELPTLQRFSGLRFVDTPGLESALLHNTEEALKWLPNAGMALVAISVDPPLSQNDVELIRRLYRFTPNVTVLLTKVDLLSPAERMEVTAFVNEQLRRSFDPAPRVALYSIQPGFDALRVSLERQVFDPVLAEFGQQRAAIIGRKIQTLLRECSEYLILSLTAAELADSHREALREQLLGRREAISDFKSQLRLITHHAQSGTRAFAERRFQSYQKPIQDELLNFLDVEFPKWTKSLSSLLDSFGRWLGSSLKESLAAASLRERASMAERVQSTALQVRRLLQDFRNRLSDETMQAFGVPLRTTEVEIQLRDPESPGIHVGKIFDRNWELLSPIVPVWMIQGIVRRHFRRQIAYKVFANLSRLVSQWEERINASLSELEKEAGRRAHELLSTVAHLIENSGGERIPAMRLDLERIETLRSENGDSFGRPTRV